MKASISPTVNSHKINENVISTVLSDGTEVFMRMMTANDLIFMEKLESKQRDKTETERTMSLIERLVTGDSHITIPEMKNLQLSDFRKLTDLMSTSSGAELSDGEDEDKE